MYDDSRSRDYFSKSKGSVSSVSQLAILFFFLLCVMGTIYLYEYLIHGAATSA